MQNKRIDINTLCTYGALTIGILLGCLYFLASIAYNQHSLLDYGLEDYDISAMMNAPYHEIMFHLLKKRLLQILIFILLIYLTTYDCSAFVFCAGFGAYYGIVVSNLIIKYGLSGLMYGLACFFPHYLIYFMIIVLCGKWRGKGKNKFQNCYRDMNRLQFFSKFFVIVLLLFLSIGWEIKFQKNFLNYFFQYLV